MTNPDPASLAEGEPDSPAPNENELDGAEFHDAPDAEREDEAESSDSDGEDLAPPVDGLMATTGMADTEGFRSGFVTFLGRPNAGKSTLINQICGMKVAIVSNKPQTTRNQLRGILHRSDCQIVFVDTPGIHKPVTALGERLNSTASSAIEDVDVVCLLIDATKPMGKGDQFVADKLPPESVVIVNKTDIAKRDTVVEQLIAASGLDAAEYFPVSAKTGEGVEALVEYLVSRLPEGPRYYPEDMITDTPEQVHIAELVREELFARTRQELPYSIATRVTEWEGQRIRCEILVERDSQKGMVIGKAGALLKEVGTAVRKQLPEGTFLELHVAVDKDWQRRPGRIQELGY